ncbi:MAG TPA: GNAT family N-acetyltransferase [Terricaulis sp.]|nr:GNAT family N-acetyltransferase [Terricaulis sp.]
MRIETIHPKDMGDDLAALWRAHQRADCALASPYLSPDWARAVGAARADARVCVIDGGRGFLGAQRLSRFSAMGLGAPIADTQGLVSEAGVKVSAGALCRALNVGRIDFTHAPTGQTLFKPAHSEGAWVAETFGGRDLYEAALRVKRAEFVRQTDKKLRKLERAQHVEFGVSTDRADFETLLAWKGAQLKATGQPAIWDTPWVRQVIDACFAARAPHFAGRLFTMHIDGRLAAANFCLAGERTLYMWIIAHDDAFEAASPGVQLARWVIGWAGEHGLAEVDFGPGDYRYKRQLATTQRMLDWGVASGGSFSGAVRGGLYAVRAGVERLPAPALAALPGKAMRKRDMARALAA